MYHVEGEDYKPLEKHYAKAVELLEAIKYKNM